VHEGKSLRNIGDDTDADWPLGRSFPSIWSEILRRLRRNDQANSRWSMQPHAGTAAERLIVKGQYCTRGTQCVGCCDSRLERFWASRMMRYRTTKTIRLGCKYSSDTEESKCIASR
jgi:hypothetical protein